MDGINVMNGKFLCVGMGETNLAVSSAIKLNGGEVIATDDFPSPKAKQQLEKMDIELLIHPSPRDLKGLAREADYCIPTPGLKDVHPIYSFLKHQPRKYGTLISELDYAASLTEIPIVAITGTNGKSTVVEMVHLGLMASGIKSVVAGNTDVPFSKAVLENANCEVFVIEASSFQLRNSNFFNPKVAAWLNLAPNHLDKHASIGTYVDAKAKIWERITDDDCWVANAEDAVISYRHPDKGKGLTFGASSNSTKEANIEAAQVIATAIGGDSNEVAQGIKDFKGLPHRMEIVSNTDGITWINDSKATTPHAVKAGLSNLKNTVLILGGRDKSGTFSELVGLANIKAVVAMGESAPQLVEIFRGVCPVAEAKTMNEAVLMASGFAAKDDTVLFSPGGSSFDWYDSYIERGEDFKMTLKKFLEK